MTCLKKKSWSVLINNAFNAAHGCQLFVLRGSITPEKSEQSFTSYRKNETSSLLLHLPHLLTPPCAPSGSSSHHVTHTYKQRHTHKHSRTQSNIPTGVASGNATGCIIAKPLYLCYLYLSARPLNLRGMGRNLTHCSPLSSSIVGIHSTRAQWSLAGPGHAVIRKKEKAPLGDC